MKRYGYILLILALLLCGCASKLTEQPATEPTTAPTTAPTQASQPTAVPTIAPTSEPTTAPTTEPTTAPTTEPTTPPTTESAANPNENILLFWYHGIQPFPYMDALPDVSNCVMDHLYAFDKKTREIRTVCDSPIATFNSDDVCVYYVKAAEPTKIYATPFRTFDRHWLVYESNGGSVSSVFFVPEQFHNQAIQFVVNNKQHVWLDLITGESKVMMEQYYILQANVDTNSPHYHLPVEKWQDYERIYFVGKLNEEDKLNTYYYYRSTGKTEICPYL